MFYNAFNVDSIFWCQGNSNRQYFVFLQRLCYLSVTMFNEDSHGLEESLRILKYGLWSLIRPLAVIYWWQCASCRRILHACTFLCSYTRNMSVWMHALVPCYVRGEHLFTSITIRQITSKVLAYDHTCASRLLAKFLLTVLSPYGLYTPPEARINRWSNSTLWV